MTEKRAQDVQCADLRFGAQELKRNTMRGARRRSDCLRDFDCTTVALPRVDTPRDHEGGTAKNDEVRVPSKQPYAGQTMKK